MNRRVLGAALLTLGLALSACVAPAPRAAPDGPKQNVTVWMYPVIGDEAKGKAFWDAAEKDFAAQSPRYTVSIVVKPAADLRTIAKAIDDGSGPDMVLLTSETLPALVAGNQLLPLEAAQDTNFMPLGVRDATVDGRIYAIPLYQSVTTTAYNAKAFRAAGVNRLPTTWTGVLQAAPQLALKKVAVMDYDGDAPLATTFYPLLWQAGGNVFAADGKSVAFYSEAGISALEFLVALMKAKGLPPTSATGTGAAKGSGLTSGSIAMTTSATASDVEAMSKALGASNVTVGTPLKGEAGLATYGTSGLLARTALAKDEVGVTAVASFLGSADFETKLMKASGALPGRIDVTAKDDSTTTRAFLAALQYSRAPQYNPKADEVAAILAEEIRSALAGKKSASAALNDAAQRSNLLLAG